MAAHDSIVTTPGSVFTGEVEAISRSGAQAVFFAGGGGAGTVALWRALHSADPHLLLLGSSSLTAGDFASAIGAAGAITYLTTPVLAPQANIRRPPRVCSATTAVGSAARRACTRCTAMRR